ncbi:hypothetical protein D3C76_1485950 [compost metagenome]
MDELLEALIVQLHHVGFRAVSPFKPGNQGVIVERLGGDRLRCGLGLSANPTPGELPGKWKNCVEIDLPAFVDQRLQDVGRRTHLVGHMVWHGNSYPRPP